MSRSDFLRVVGLYVASLVGGTGFWVLLFHTPILAASVFFYRGLILLALTAVIVSVVLAWVRRASFRALIGVRDILLIVTLLASVNIVFFTHVPVTADRSISIFMLAYMNRAEGPLTRKQISDNVVEEYVLERRAVDKRLEEQLVTGTLLETPEGYVISKQGRTLIAFYELIARLFNIAPENLAP